MIDYKTKYVDAKNEILKLAENVMDENSLHSFVKTIDEKIEDFKPSLMLYGTYNSGKSTLLNALYGEEEKAKTGDCPETCEIVPYDWNGYTIYDTPGIDAPSEHEELTQEHLDKTEIVLFIVSNDGAFEEDYIYEKVADIVSIGKPLVFILNNKTGEEAVGISEAIIGINKKLIKIGDRKGIKEIETKVQVLYVDAQAALDGKLDNEQLLIVDSNIENIEAEINKLFLEGGMGEVIANLNRYFEQFIDQMIAKIDNKIDNKLIQELEKQITKLSSEHVRNNSRIKLQSEKEIEYIGNDVKSLLLDGSEENELNQFVADSMKKVSVNIQNEFSSIFNGIQKDEEEYLDELEKVDLQYGKISSLNLEKDDEGFSEETKIHLNEVGDVLKKGLTDKKLIEEGAKDALLKLREFGVKGFKGKWEKTLGKTAEKIGKWAGPAVRIGMAAYEIYNSENEHEKMLQEKRDYVQSAQNEASKLVQSLNQEVGHQINLQLSNLYAPLIDNKKNIIEEVTGENELFTDLKDKLVSVKMRFV